MWDALLAWSDARNGIDVDALRAELGDEYEPGWLRDDLSGDIGAFLLDTLPGLPELAEQVIDALTDATARRRAEGARR